MLKSFNSCCFLKCIIPEITKTITDYFPNILTELTGNLETVFVGNIVTLMPGAFFVFDSSFWASTHDNCL